MKGYLYIALFLFFLFPTVDFLLPNSNAQGWQWAKELTPSVFSAGERCETDIFDNIYGSGGTINGVVCKFDTSGGLKWVRNIVQRPISIKADKSGHIYAFSFYLMDSITIGTTALHHSSPSSSLTQFYVVKFDTAGNIVWAKNMGTGITGSLSEHYGTSNSLAVDSIGNFFITYPFWNNATIGPFSFTNMGLNDALVAKLDSTGNVIWAKSIGGSNSDDPWGIALTPSNNLYITGLFYNDTLTFGSTTLSSVGRAYYLAKLDSNGNFIWAKKKGGSGYVVAYDIATDNDESIFITGLFGGTISFGSFTFTCYSGGNNGFLTKYDSTGNVVWAKSTQSCYPATVTVDKCGDVWMLAGAYTEIDTIDGHVFTAPTPFGDIMHIARWNKAGFFIEGSTLPDGGENTSQLAFDSKNNAYATSNYSIDTFYVGPDTLLNGGNWYMFVARYMPFNECGTIPEGIPNTQTHPVTLEIYPNPATNEIVIRNDNVSLTNAIAYVYDISGRLEVTSELSHNAAIIPVSQLTPGLYYCKIVLVDKSVIIRKFIVQ